MSTEDLKMGIWMGRIWGDEPRGTYDRAHSRAYRLVRGSYVDEFSESKQIGSKLPPTFRCVSVRVEGGGLLPTGISFLGQPELT